ncbi:MAG: universal stress protein [Bacteroidota bacterium]|nr:universal stress protein [Bacteroidota bacterium]
MKKLIVGMDFSKGSLSALEYALRFAAQTKMDIRMVWVDKLASSDTIFSHHKENEGRAEAKKGFNSLIEKYSDTEGIGKLDFKLLRGKVWDQLSKYANEYGADTIIVGTHGITGYEEYWIGSNANRIILYAGCSVISVKYNYEMTQGIKKIICPIDNTSDTLQKLPYTVKIAKAFGSEVILLGVYTTNLKSVNKKVDSTVSKAMEYLEKFNVSFQKEFFRSETISKVVLDYAQKYNADLISIVTEQESVKNNMLLGKYSSQVVNNSPIPVLSIQTKNNFSL